MKRKMIIAQIIFGIGIIVAILCGFEPLRHTGTTFLICLVAALLFTASEYKNRPKV